VSGFFVVTCDDYDALVEAAEVLVRAHPVVKIRPVKQFRAHAARCRVRRRPR
jgi:hypothetical protein